MTLLQCNIKNKPRNTSFKQLQGLVVSNKMDKTIVVEVERTYRHALYNKVVRARKRYKVHDENKVAAVGNTVVVAECAPLSKTKHMVLVRVVKS